MKRPCALILCSSNYLIVSTYLTDLNRRGAPLVICPCNCRRACVSRRGVVPRKVIRNDYSELRMNLEAIINKLIYSLISTADSPWSTITICTAHLPLLYPSIHWLHIITYIYRLITNTSSPNHPPQKFLHPLRVCTRLVAWIVYCMHLCMCIWY